MYLACVLANDLDWYLYSITMPQGYPTHSARRKADMAVGNDGGAYALLRRLGIMAMGLVMPAQRNAYLRSMQSQIELLLRMEQDTYLSRMVA
ncbi:hypothetical protein DSO57_1022803 [Entomophthora muscae]|uniref:Uncharacterized protein n=1 Tax=Entomophthora muscae TaxID=34485 RepID=A0ACC2TE85_9FUNG|nr:hypothetical protein DSO57_1022803 [Entomophthora muscae]